MAGITLSNSAATLLEKINIVSNSTSKLGGTINVAGFRNLTEFSLTASGITSFVSNNKLLSLELSQNNLSNFPTLSSNPNLKTLIISNDNVLSGSLPSFDSNNALETLNVSNNFLTGSLPDFKIIPALKIADFRNNDFSGDIPALTANTKLNQFYTNENNKLSGLIPELSACSDLRNVNITNNGLDGNFHDFHKTPELETYHGGRNNISGAVPTLSATQKIITADFSGNNLSGPLPSLVFNTSLKNFKSYNNNNISGPFPEFPALNTNFEIFDARNNDLSGFLPPLSSTPNLLQLIGARNPGNLTGPLPQFSDAPKLQKFEFTGHQFTGTIPDLSNNTKLRHFNVNSNALSGEFPQTLNCPDLINLRFNDNASKLGSPGISGNVPTISACTSLRILDVANNILTGYAGGPFPASLENLQAQENNLTSEAVNAILAAIVAAGSSNGICNLKGSNAAPTGQGLIDVETLRNERGWNVNVN